jgi:hypothetical protein
MVRVTVYTPAWDSSVHIFSELPRRGDYLALPGSDPAGRTMAGWRVVAVVHDSSIERPETEVYVVPCDFGDEVLGKYGGA